MPSGCASATAWPRSVGGWTPAGILHLPNLSHIVPVMVGDAVRCKQTSNLLMERFAIYVQPINYPTVARGTERLRLTPSPLHSDTDIDRLIAALTKIWTKPGLERRAAA
jgi:5-aminolevulinate synthase